MKICFSLLFIFVQFDYCIKYLIFTLFPEFDGKCCIVVLVLVISDLKLSLPDFQIKGYQLKNRLRTPFQF